ncbi:SDR family NAD(P)-dependent oxidoreductase, partial [Salmonella enterica]|nr:SDR family NAD(P)-dependent oxidoreductase [Salmonella enterica]
MSTDPTPGHAVVTGATGGIGQAIVQRLLDGGWRVTGLDLGPAVARHAAYRHVEVDLCDDAATRQASQ